ncbi:MAG: nucleoside deaminase [bacterium]|nr:nucleoside deaminase [bacterium]
MDDYYMNLALKEAKKAYKHNEVPVGAIIVKGGKILSKAHNKKEKSKNTINHAEILCISKACKKIKNWRLDDCDIYITLEPCMMCCGAIKQARIKKIVYAVRNVNDGCTDCLNNIEIVSKIKETECKKMIQDFFKRKRQNL